MENPEEILEGVNVTEQKMLPPAPAEVLEAERKRWADMDHTLTWGN